MQVHELKEVANKFRETIPSKRPSGIPDVPDVDVEIPHYARSETFVAALCDKIAARYPGDKDVAELVRRIREKGNAGAVKNVLDHVAQWGLDPAPERKNEVLQEEPSLDLVNV